MQPGSAIVIGMASTESELAPVIRKWVNDILQQEGIDPTKLARLTGVSQSSLSRLRSGDSDKLAPRSLQKLARRYGAGTPPEVKELLAKMNLLPDDTAGAPASESEGAGIPIWGVIPIGKSGEFFANALPVAHLRRPPALRQARHIVAFYAPDDTMAPRWTAGEPVVVDLNRPASAGNYALIKLLHPHDENGDEVYIFRRIVRRGEGKLWVCTEEPGAEAEGIPLARLLEPRRVLDWRDLLA